jgi:hypothetical protein
MVPTGLSLMWGGLQELRFRGVQRQFRRHLRSAALRGILGQRSKEFFNVGTGIGYTDIGVQEQEQHITKALAIGKHIG